MRIAMRATRAVFRVISGMLLGVYASFACSQTSPAVFLIDSSMTMLTVASTSFVSGENIPSRFTCDGSNISPDIQWSRPPAGTKSIALVMNDPDAPQPFAHWLVYDISPDAHGIGEGMSTPSTRLVGAKEGVNSFGDVGYGGPCPPSGETHRYTFHVYALNTTLTSSSGENMDRLLAALKGHVLAVGTMNGIFGH